MRQPRSTRLIEVLREYPRVAVVTHDYPDPDAIAAGWALVYMIKKVLGKSARLLGGGGVVRAENRWMVEQLKPPLEIVSQIEDTDGLAAILVDCSPASGNHLLARQSLVPVANIDHHAPKEDARVPLRFRDVRPRAAATASIVAGYLREQKIAPSASLATAMLYAFKSETQGHETHYTRSDRAVFSWLTERADPSKLAEIENAPLPRAYYSDLVLALQGTFLYGDTALCLLPRAAGPETVAEIADLLVRCERIRRVLCGGMVGRDLAVSLRTAPDAGSAAVLARQVLSGLGDGGGHEHRAGGQIREAGEPGRLSPEIQEQIRTRWLEACAVDQQRGTRLVARREIMENL
jgi:nanoRNase/pAp phosphatase (c-di-AMP/oligoRNAs hydrolase)